ncbi:hypothetical protein BKN38_01010 [Helicobacter sp. CLO-3]|nr:hypothetical protein BA723_05360 [Helicobacter sp. CLO-3]OHU85672.1 hypothetical protein BKN38_01010 [Helicobacter sp. CLO-3]
MNLDFGWQWYYAQNAGFRFKGYIGYSNYNSKKMGNITDTTSLPMQTANIDVSIHALQYGLEASYLYDFIYKGNHNFGAHVSTGFEGSTFVGQGADANMAEGYTLTTNFPSYSKFTWTTGIGIHYFYKVHHQVFISYLYRGYTNSKMVFNKDGNGEGELGSDIFQISTTPRSTIMLSYAYKF